MALAELRMVKHGYVLLLPKILFNCFPIPYIAAVQNSEVHHRPYTPTDNGDRTT